MPTKNGSLAFLLSVLAAVAAGAPGCASSDGRAQAAPGEGAGQAAASGEAGEAEVAGEEALGAKLTLDSGFLPARPLARRIARYPASAATLAATAKGTYHEIAAWELYPAIEIATDTDSRKLGDACGPDSMRSVSAGILILARDSRNRPKASIFAGTKWDACKPVSAGGEQEFFRQVRIGNNSPTADIVVRTQAGKTTTNVLSPHSRPLLQYAAADARARATKKDLTSNAINLALTVGIAVLYPSAFAPTVLSFAQAIAGFGADVNAAMLASHAGRCEAKVNMPSIGGQRCQTQEEYADGLTRATGEQYACTMQSEKFTPAHKCDYACCKVQAN